MGLPPERRREARMPYLGVRLRLRGATWTRESECLAYDLTREGIGIESAGSGIAEGEDVEIEVELPGEDSTRTLPGRIAWSAREATDAAVTRLGVEFQRLSTEQREALRAAVVREADPPSGPGPYGCPFVTRRTMLVLRPGSLFDSLSTEGVRRALSVALATTSGDVVVDVSGVKFLSSSHWGVLLSASRAYGRRKRRLLLAGGDAAVDVAHKTLGLSRYLPRFATVDEAVSG